MKLTHLFLSLTICMAASSQCFAEKFIAPNHRHISYIGRVSTTDTEAHFSFPGVQIRTVFKGDEISMKIKPDCGFFMVEIDEMPPFKIESPKNDSIIKLAQRLPKGEHQLTITYVNEGLDLRPVFKGFILPNNGSLKKANLPKRKIEFIGNSITCGYGVEGENEKCGFEYSTENQYLSYAAITARNLDAQCFVVARSGIGVYRNYNDDPNGDKLKMPEIYPYTQFGGTGEKWDFKKYKPHVVCINLGTNDTSTEPYDTNLLYDNYLRFYKMVRSNYPKAKIILLTGPMLGAGSKALNELKNTLNKIKEIAQDPLLYRLDFTPEDGSMGYGSDYHPSKKRQAFMAEELTAFLSELMGW